ncbi:GNAT family N-acetyltransferase [Pseudovibrio sp. SPO723]|uniref:GNAT family N-acetyltransferase n=1 Tax=Nesiotobacter zosterae TaxID=392721 RepID=UPI0029C26C4C|nr:GNAT family N-acetyltransferase [Pseudovibrio sp. SPO723]MDX5593986.1 GNAT family N-acetyltransferase [Pseudovibrio sp. SPO723]
MQVDVIEGLDAFKSLRENWNEIYSKDTEAQYFLSWQWVHMLHLKSGSNIFILGARPTASSAYVALFPMRIRTRYNKANNAYYNDICMAGNFAADYTGFICDPAHDNEALPALGQKLANMDWARLQLENLACSPERVAQLTAPIMKRKVYPTDLSRTNTRDNINNLVCPVTELPDTFEDYLSQCMSSKSRQKLRRFMRKAKDDPDLSFTIPTEETFNQHLDILMGFWRDKWAERKGRNVDILVRNHRHMLTLAFRYRQLFMPMLWHQDRPVGGLASFIDPVRKSLLFYLAGRDETWSGPPPGLILHGASIEWAISKGLKTYDFLRGNEAYKYSYGAKDRLLICRQFNTPNSKNFSGKLDPRSVSGVLKKATEDFKAKNLTRARAGLEQVLETQPEVSSALYMLGQLLVLENNYEEAAKVFTRMTHCAPDNPRGWTRLGQSYLALQDFIEAEVAFRQALELDPNNIAIRSHLADTLVALRLRDEAAEAYKAVLAVLPKTPTEQRLVNRATAALRRLRPLELFGAATPKASSLDLSLGTRLRPKLPLNITRSNNRIN